MLRAIITGTDLVLFFVLTLPLLGLLWLIRPINPAAVDRFSFKILRWEAGIVTRLAGVKLTVMGQENIPDEACLFVSNHRSYFDIIIALSLARPITGFVAKQELGRVPSLRIWMRRIKCVFLNRDDIRAGMQVILDAIEHIKSGFSMYIFPEGHRYQDDYLHEFKGGSFKIATKTGCPIVPVAIYGADDVFENHMPFVKVTNVIFQYGKPIYPKDLPKEELKKIAPIVSDTINTMLIKNTPYAGIPAPGKADSKKEGTDKDSSE